MNFFELINKCLMELNYRPLSYWQELIKPEHTRIKEVINRVNSEICHSADWWFLQRKAQIRLPKGDYETENPINGRIETIELDQSPLKYSPDYRSFFHDPRPSGRFSLFDSKLLFPGYDKDVVFDVYYYTNDCARSGTALEKPKLENEADESLIPERNLEQLLVYGACMRLKANPEHNRFKYWNAMYTDAIENLRSRSDLKTDSYPKITIQRN